MSSICLPGTCIDISSEKDTISRLRKDIKQLNLKLTQLQTVLEEKDAQLRHLRSDNTLKKEADSSRSNTSAITESVIPERRSILDAVPSNNFSATSNRGESVTEIAATSLDMSSDSVGLGSVDPSIEDDKSDNTYDASSFGFYNGEEGSRTEDEEFSEVKVNFQETFLGHTGPISRSRFSATGNNIASASADGTVRIWTYDSSTPSSRNATIYCGAEVLSLDWESKSDRLLLIGTADAGIKAWNVDAKRVVCDLNTDDSYPRILDIKCSPVEPVFVSAAASGRSGSKSTETGEFASLTVWNMKLWKAMTVLPLGEDPPAITSLCFNHNGKILAASAVDGMIHMFDMSAGLQITGWPAHDSAISSILFGPDETSIFSLGSDGKVFEWSLQNQGRVLWQTDCSRFHIPEISKNYRHEMALDSDGRRLLVTSDSVRSPMYQVRGYGNSLKTLPHSSAVTTVDWHPTLPIFLTGSADNSIRVTSIL
ncbi:WD repeat-containing protein 91 homolog [Phyllobates terribilis]|uniref:WD repeat-containing protein 91 homolog n=1 Tax=Phyllobates terribilis TaxID=111132 RepID=UPI003CCB5D3B